MTCIIGWAEDDNVWIGGDSAGVAGYDLRIRADEKVFKKGEFIFGFTSSFRMGQLIRHKLFLPKPEEGQNSEEYLHSLFLDSLIKCFKDNQYAEVKDGKVIGGCFLFGYRGNLYQVESDFQIVKVQTCYDAVGCGAQIALGCLYGMKGIPLSPILRIQEALQAAEMFSAGVRSPFKIISISR